MVKIPQKTRQITIAPETYLALEDLAAKEREKTSNELIKAMITPRSYAQKILAAFVKRKQEAAVGGKEE